MARLRANLFVIAHMATFWLPILASFPVMTDRERDGLCSPCTVAAPEAGSCVAELSAGTSPSSTRMVDCKTPRPTWVRSAAQAGRCYSLSIADSNTPPGLGGKSFTHWHKISRSPQVEGRSNPDND